METTKTLEAFISAEQLTKHLGISRAVLGRWMDHGLPYIRVGLKLYFREASVAAWLASQEKVRQSD